MIGTPNIQTEKTKTVDHCGPVTLVNNDDKPQNPHNLKICHPCLMSKTMSSITGWTQWSKRVKTEKKFTGSKIGAIFCKITSRITTQNLKIGPWGLFEKFAFLFFPIIKSVPRKGQNTPKSDFRGPKIPPEVRVRHETCSTICGTPVQAILDQKNLTGSAGGAREGQNMAHFGHFNGPCAPMHYFDLPWPPPCQPGQIFLVQNGLVSHI